MIIFNYHVWNRLVPLDDPELRIKAIRGDIVFSSNGFLFLIQRKKDFNNIVCFSLSKCSPINNFRKCKVQTFMKAIDDVYYILKTFNITYFRIEGNNRRYWFLLKLKDKRFNIIKDLSITNRNVLYGRIF